MIVFDHIGEWWKEDIAVIRRRLFETGGDANRSDAFTINGQPGDLYPCSKQGELCPLYQPNLYPW